MIVSDKSMAHLPVGNSEQSQLFDFAIPEEKAIRGVLFVCLFVFKQRFLEEREIISMLLILLKGNDTEYLQFLTWTCM